MVVGHSDCIHLFPSKAPQPHFPDASAVTERWGLALSKRVSMEVPFQWEANRDHHRMSDLAAPSRRM